MINRLMGICAEKWVCPRCKRVVGGSLGELRNHYKRIHFVKAKVEKPVIAGQAAAA
jgi:hypothetical protein